MNEWLQKTRAEFSARARNNRLTADRCKLHGNYAGYDTYTTAAVAWTSAADMLQYLIDGNYDCLKEFLYNLEDEDDE